MPKNVVKMANLRNAMEGARGEIPVRSREFWAASVGGSVMEGEQASYHTSTQLDLPHPAPRR